VLANNFAIYGGRDIAVLGNLATDTVVQGGGIHVGNRFGAVPLSGTTTIARNMLMRTGSLDLFSHVGTGALWFAAFDSPLDGRVEARHNLIHDSAYEAVQFIGSSVTNVHFDHDATEKARDLRGAAQRSGVCDVQSRDGVPPRRGRAVRLQLRLRRRQRPW